MKYGTRFSRRYPFSVKGYATLNELQTARNAWLRWHLKGIADFINWMLEQPRVRALLLECARRT